VAALLSTLLWVTLACLSAPALPARAHEVQPAVSDLTIDSNTMTLDIVLSLEPLVAGADLEGLEDTNASDRAEDIDRLRAFTPAALEQAFIPIWPRIRDGIVVRSDDRPVVLELVGLEIPEVGDTALPRLSRLRLAAALPPGDSPVIVGWNAEFGALVVRQMGAGDDAYSGYLTGGAASVPIPRTGAVPQSAITVFLDYVGIGFEHIIPKGLDHILFVLGLFFLSTRLAPLLWQVTAFTLAHTLTLALGILGYVSVPASIVEPLIAVSIAYVGIENVLSRGLTPWRPAIVFMFGLLHGLGFASVLGDIGLNPTQFATGLIGFNVGVELGQLSVIAIGFLLIGYWFRNKPWYRSRISNPASIAIASMGIYWAIERTVL